MGLDHWNKLSLEYYDDGFAEEFNRKINNYNVPHANYYENSNDTGNEDHYVNMEIEIPRGDSGKLQHATVKSRKLNYKV